MYKKLFTPDEAVEMWQRGQARVERARNKINNIIKPLTIREENQFLDLVYSTFGAKQESEDEIREEELRRGITQIIGTVVVRDGLRNSINVSLSVANGAVRNVAELTSEQHLISLSQSMRQHIESTGFRFMDEMNKTTQKRLTDMIGRNFAQGTLTQTQVIEEAQKIFKTLRQSRVDLLARTLGNYANGFGTYGGILQSEIATHIQWWARTDDWSNVRDRHKAMHGEIVEKGKPFRIGVLHPPEGFRCRCQPLPVEEVEDALEEGNELSPEQRAERQELREEAI